MSAKNKTEKGKRIAGKLIFAAIFVFLQCIFLPSLPAQNNQNLEEDLRYFQSQLEQQPNSPDLNYNMAQVHFLMGNIDESIRFLERTIFLDPSDKEARLKLASIYRKIGKLWDARELLKSAVKTSPKSSDIWYELGITLTDLASYQEALTAFQNALQYCSTDEQKYLIIYYSGILHLSNRDYTRFKECLQRLAKSPKHYVELKKLGRLWKSD